LVTTMEISSVFKKAGAPSANSTMTSLALHVGILAVLLLARVTAVHRVEPPKKEFDVVFYRPAAIPIPAPVIPLPRVGGTNAAGPPMGGAPAPAAKPKPNNPAGPEGPGKPELPKGPHEGFSPEAKPSEPESTVGKAGILAFKDKIASLAQDTAAPRLGADARYGAAVDVGHSSSGSVLTTNTPGSSGGINVGSLSRGVGGGGGRGGGGGGGGASNGTGGAGGGGMPGVAVARATSSISGIGGGDRPKAHSGPGAARTDEEIQIVFDRYKASFYRLYGRELRNNPSLQGKMVLRLTIEPDGSVSMCKLQSTDMNAPDLAVQVVERVKAMNFGAKEGVQTVTIVYPIDFLPAS
jgi:uncharacterized membrane protein YgcG